MGNILARTGYIANVVQTGQALSVIRLLFTLIPAAFIVGGIIFIGFFPINAAFHKKITDEIRQRSVTAG